MVWGLGFVLAVVAAAADMLSFLDLCCDAIVLVAVLSLGDECVAVSFFDDRKLPFCLLLVCDRSIDR